MFSRTHSNCMLMALLALWIGFSQNVRGADFQAGVDAFHRGDLRAAISEWQRAADAGHPQAQRSLAKPLEAMYDVRRKVRDSLSLSYPAKTALAIACSEGTLTEGLTNTSEWLGLPAADQISSDSVQSVEAIGVSVFLGRVTVTFKPAAGIPDGGTVVYSGRCGSAGMNWEVSGSLDEFLYKEQVSVDTVKLIAQAGNAHAQYELAQKFATGKGLQKDLRAALLWAGKAHSRGHREAGELYARLVLQEIVYASDIRALTELGDSVQNECSNEAKCIFSRIWAYLDISGDGRLSIAEIARFQRNLVKFAAVSQEGENIGTEDIAALNLASILLFPVTAASILHSFDYDNDELLSKEELFGGETEFARLVGLDTKLLTSTLDFKSLGEQLLRKLDSVPYLK